ncbi:hypothetical protein HOY82DRAFT_552135 [Tuber indicum]|nr:hypothetical protein HOY82DRAFT_552135 [Tuber indicum]
MTPTLAPTVAHSASPEYMSIATSSVPSQIVLNEGATTGKAVKTPRTRTPRQAPQGPPRRSLRIIASAQKSRKGVSVTGSIAQEGGGTVVDTPVPKKEIVAGGLGGQIEMEPVIKVKSPILKPRAGTGIAKKKVTAEYLKGLLVANIKALVEMKGEMELKENQGITTTTPTVTLTETQIPASLGVHPLSTKSPNTARGSTPSPDKAKKAPRVKTPHRKTQGPRRRSARITESARKSAQVKPAAQEGGAKVDAKPKSPILRPRAGSGVTKKTGAGGSKGRISAGAKTKAKEEEKVKHPALMMPRAEARLRKGCIRGGPSLAARRQARRKLLV